MSRATLILTAAAIVLLHSCGSVAPPTPAALTPVRVAYAPVVLNTPLYMAEDKGWFREAGLQVEPKPFTTANDMVNALIAGQVDVITGVSLVPLLNLELQSPGKFRILIHSKMTDEQPYDSIVVGKNSSVKSIEGLRSKKVAVYPGTTATNLIRAFLKKKGIAPESIQLVQLPPPSHIAALSAGSVDALFAYEPTLSVVESAGARRIHGSVFVALMDPSPISGSVISRTFESSHPEESKRFAAVLDRAITATRSDPSEARKTLVSHTKLAPEIAPKVRLVADVTSTETDVELVQRFIDLLVEIGELKGRVAAEGLLRKN